MIIRLFIYAVHAAELLCVGFLLLLHHLVFFDLLGSRQGWHRDMVELSVSPVVLISLLQHHPVSRIRVEDLLEHEVSDIGNKSNHR
jgi:hypothetical protein